MLVADEHVVGLDTLVGMVEELVGLQVQQWRDLGGSRTTNLALQIDKGATIVARFHARDTTQARVAAEQAARTELSSAHLPTVVPFALRRLPNGQLVELEPYVAAEDRMNTPERLTAGYRLLGRQPPRSSRRRPDSSKPVCSECSSGPTRTCTATPSLSPTTSPRSTNTNNP